MKLLRDLLYTVKLDNVLGLTNMAIETITFDSRKPMKFGLFVAVRGTLSDGHEYISQAIEKGAIAIVCEEMPEEIDKNITYVHVENSRRALGRIAANFYEHPSTEMKVIGVTGTNGKTSIVTLLYDLFRALGYKCGLLSTIRNKIDDHELDAKHTTPDPIQLNAMMRQMVEHGCSHCFMEVSSHAMDQYRVEGIRFEGGVFTNLSHDHLDYHKTFNAYLLAKKKFFDGLDKSAFALINDDDKHAGKMVTQTAAKVYSYALKTEADYKGKIIENQFDGMLVNIDGEEVWLKLLGGFNAYNALAVYAVTQILEVEKFEALKALSGINPVEGRFQYIQCPRQISGIVDYAHTPDALDKVLKTISEIRTGNEQLITVVGCGGNRDKEKRPMMAEIAAKYSNKIILTSDNPRNEKPESIIEEMYAGIDASEQSKVLRITERAEAIKTAAAIAGEGDIVLIAGKGHETYQEINGERFHFDDRKILKESFK